MCWSTYFQNSDLKLQVASACCRSAPKTQGHQNILRIRARGKKTVYVVWVLFSPLLQARQSGEFWSQIQDMEQNNDW